MRCLQHLVRIEPRNRAMPFISLEQVFSKRLLPLTHHTTSNGKTATVLFHAFRIAYPIRSKPLINRYRILHFGLRSRARKQMLGLGRNGPVQGKQLVLGIEFLNECKKAQIRTRRRERHPSSNSPAFGSIACRSFHRNYFDGPNSTRPMSHRPNRFGHRRCSRYISCYRQPSPLPHTYGDSAHGSHAAPHAGTQLQATSYRGIESLFSPFHS